ncbi:hypothetical protein GQ54DRAFT_314916 [Martensiomyces pterosporus]|nr:hypothetical protein GQ54DRAFT_314916 [Martensiomyces pterosporus]
MSLSTSTNSNNSSSMTLGGFPSLPSSPTTMLPESTKFLTSPNLESDEVVQKCGTSTCSSRSSRINLEGSWLDLESDDDDDYSPRMRRKNSAASSKGSGSGKATLANIKELTRRSSMHLRKLTNKMAGH